MDIKKNILPPPKQINISLKAVSIPAKTFGIGLNWITLVIRIEKVAFSATYTQNIIIIIIYYSNYNT